ncbi:hypothetical protein PIROE2DRAFT_62022 [Piromyces sp. E2]|nr:hypothetical protein PIROE2DRAFT_62022 [Piromyces sp. E2]|eukprot:OUM62225.1 hypothetical protein PIROE2DRAFT_62022 [Piromyces sp. E2]
MDLLNKYKKEVPKTWDDLIKTGKYIYNEELKNNNNNYNDLIIYNGSINKNDESGTSSIIEFIHSFRKSKNDTFPELDSQDAIEALEKLKELKNEISSGRKEGISSSLLGGNNIAASIYSSEEKQNAAIKVIEFITSKEIQKEFSLKNNYFTGISSLYDDDDDEVCGIIIIICIGFTEFGQITVFKCHLRAIYFFSNKAKRKKEEESISTEITNKTNTSNKSNNNNYDNRHKRKHGEITQGNSEENNFNQNVEAALPQNLSGGSVIISHDELRSVYPQLFNMNEEKEEKVRHIINLANQKRIKKIEELTERLEKDILSKRLNGEKFEELSNHFNNIQNEKKELEKQLEESRNNETELTEKIERLNQKMERSREKRKKLKEEKNSEIENPMVQVVELDKKLELKNKEINELIKKISNMEQRSEQIEQVVNAYKKECQFNFTGSVIKISAIDGNRTINNQPLSFNNFYDGIHPCFICGINKRVVNANHKSFSVYDFRGNPKNFTDNISRLIYSDTTGSYLVSANENPEKKITDIYRNEVKFKFDGSILKVSEIKGIKTSNNQCGFHCLIPCKDGILKNFTQNRTWLSSYNIWHEGTSKRNNYKQDIAAFISERIKENQQKQN